MKNWRISLLAIFLLVVSLACSATVSGSTPADQSPGVSGLVPKSSGLIDTVTMAKDTQGSAKDPVNPTTVFANTDTLHAVVHLNNAPTDTQFKAIWYAVTVSSASDNNKVIDSTNITAGGTVNIDFYLTPSANWPTGTYQVEIYANGVLDQVVDFTIK